MQSVTETCGNGSFDNTVLLKPFRNTVGLSAREQCEMRVFFKNANGVESGAEP